MTSPLISDQLADLQIAELLLAFDDSDPVTCDQLMTEEIEERSLGVLANDLGLPSLLLVILAPVVPRHIEADQGANQREPGPAAASRFPSSICRTPALLRRLALEGEAALISRNKADEHRHV